MGTTVAPAHRAPRSASAHSARVLARIATRSPASMPRAASPPAISSAARPTSAYERAWGSRGSGERIATPECEAMAVRSTAGRVWGTPACGVGRGNGLLCGHVYTGVGSMRGGAGGRVGATGPGSPGVGWGARVGHQARRPSSSMAAGRTTGRTSRASSRTTVDDGDAELAHAQQVGEQEREGRGDHHRGGSGHCGSGVAQRVAGRGARAVAREHVLAHAGQQEHLIGDREAEGGREDRDDRHRVDVSRAAEERVAAGEQHRQHAEGGGHREQVQRRRRRSARGPSAARA